MTLVHVRVFGSGWPGGARIKVLAQLEVGQSKTATATPAAIAATAVMLLVPIRHRVPVLLLSR